MMIRKAMSGLMMAAAFAVAGQASANLLVNPGFEDPVILPGAESFGAPGWTDFGGGTFTISSVVDTPHTGDNSLKTFGTSGVHQTFAASAGQEWNGGAWILNSSGDLMANGQVAAVNIEWLDAGGGQISFISNGTFTADDAPVDVWTLQTITGIAPVGTASARLTLITGDFGDGGHGGAPRYDDAFFEQVPEPGSLALLGLGGLALLRRRR